jgi:uracil-DNA glycosylase
MPMAYRLEREVLDVVGRRLADELELIVVLQPVGGSRRSGRPWAGARAAHMRRSRGSAQARARCSRDGRCRRRPPCRRAQDHAAVVRPIAIQCRDQSLERALGTHVGGEIIAHVSVGDAPGEWREC